MDNCLKVTQGVDHVFNLAADMGGMGFIQSNHSVIMYNNTMISFNMLEASRINGVKRLVVDHTFSLLFNFGLTSFDSILCSFLSVGSFMPLVLAYTLSLSSWRQM
ncbi:GDP-mannose 3,5-epimerase 1 [Linum perenne]